MEGNANSTAGQLQHRDRRGRRPCWLDFL